MDAIKSAVVNKGFSQQVAKHVSCAVTDSSRRVYQSRWAKFCQWCQKNNINEMEQTIPVIADFLVYLFEEEEASTNTIKGYRTALSRTLLYSCDEDISNSVVLTDLIKAFERERPMRAVEFPKWDLRLVLEMLSKEPFEPLSQASLKLLTFKTVMLIALASASRRGEIHALDVKLITQMENWKYVKLAPNPKFLAKNFDYATGNRNFEGFVIESLKHRLGPGLEQDALLCPVRALRYYLHRTENKRKETTQLFIAINGSKPVCKNTISSWLKQTVKMAYQDCDEEVLKKLNIKAHEVRAIATSTAFYGNTAMSDLLKAVRWAAQTTFTTYYLRDVAQDLSGIYSLGPVIVAQKRIN